MVLLLFLRCSWHKNASQILYNTCEAFAIKRIVRLIYMRLEQELQWQTCDISGLDAKDFLAVLVNLFA